MATPSENFPAVSCWLEHRISYGETDAMGVVYYANYLHLFERGRGELIRGLGISYADVESRGIFLPVREAQCRYLAPARYDQIIQIRTGLSEQSRASLTFIYEITDQTRSQTLSKGMTQHATVDSTGKPIRMPDWFKALFSH